MTTDEITGQRRARNILCELLADNAKYLSGETPCPTTISSSKLRQNLADKGQKPVAAIVACADSRVAPEIAFAAEIGRLFVIRNAGNVVTEQSVLGSLEFAVHHLHVPLVVVLGHTKCGAVTAAIATARERAASLGAVGTGGKLMSPLVAHVGVIADAIKDVVGSDDEVTRGVASNVLHGVSALKAAASPISSAYSAGDIDIIGALYDIRSGKVNIVSD